MRRPYKRILHIAPPRPSDRDRVTVQLQPVGTLVHGDAPTGGKCPTSPLAYTPAARAGAP